MKPKLVIESKKFGGSDTMGVSARLPVEVITKIDEVAKKTNRNRNEVIQLCLDFALQNLEIKGSDEDGEED